jgi:hypothetical protein
MNKKVIPADFLPIDKEERTHVSTELMCFHIGRAQQTARIWAMKETYPPELKPVRILGRLGWPVAGIRKVLGVTV